MKRSTSAISTLSKGITMMDLPVKQFMLASMLVKRSACTAKLTDNHADGLPVSLPFVRGRKKEFLNLPHPWLLRKYSNIGKDV